jgi:hypothetical protein
VKLIGLNLKPEYLAFSFVLAATALLYFPGLSGPLLFDDYNSLKPLGNWGVIDSVEKLSLFLSSGLTGPTGRPVTLFTFFLNSNTWPVDTSVFILTNIVIHILNGVLLFFLIRKLTPPCDGKRSAWWCSPEFLVATLWVLHPLHTSSVLYIVQRMTLLSATFSLLTILIYLEARNALLLQQNKKALATLLGVCMAAVLALFSKENAVVLPIQILILEVYLLTLAPRSTKLHGALVWFVVVPASIIVLSYPLKAFLVHVIDYLSTGQEKTYGRDFTMFERIWTQQRVVGDYIISLVLPKMQTSGVFYDNYPISRNLFEPLATLFWLVFHISLVAFAAVYRKRLPWMFFGVFWFYGSHVIESSFVMLELKFEHRNYLPSVGIIFILTNLILLIKKSLIRNSLVFIVIAIYSCFLFMSASLWGRPLQAASVWVEENPGSSRANEHAAHMALIYGEDDARAMAFSRRAIELSDAVAPELRFILEFCETYNDEQPDWSELADRIKHGSRDWSLYPLLRELLSASISGDCGLLTLAGYRQLLAAYRDNPEYHGNLSVLLMDELELHAALHFGDKELAVELEKNRKELLLPLSHKINRSLIFASYGELELAARGLDIGIQIAEKLDNEDAFTMKNASEILELIKKDISAEVGEK